MRSHLISLFALVRLCFGQHDDEGVVFFHLALHSIDQEVTAGDKNIENLGRYLPPKPIANKFMLWEKKDALDIYKAY